MQCTGSARGHQPDRKKEAKDAQRSAQCFFLHPVQVCFCETLLFLQDQKYKEGATLLRHSMLKKVTS